MNSAEQSTPAAAAHELSSEEQRVLLRVADDAISFGIQAGREMAVKTEVYPPALRVMGATFVTLKLQGQLRGCIGSLEARRPLVADVVANAFAAAFRDPRFRPVGLHELLDLETSISILTRPTAMSFTSEADLLLQLRPGADGLIIEDRGRRGTFLPAVWEQLPTPELFLSHLKQKAGLPASHWSDSIRVWRYESRSIS